VVDEFLGLGQMSNPVAQVGGVAVKPEQPGRFQAAPERPPLLL